MRWVCARKREADEQPTSNARFSTGPWKNARAFGLTVSPAVKVSKCCKSLRSKSLDGLGAISFSGPVVTTSGDRFPGHKDRPDEANAWRVLIYDGGRLPPCACRYRHDTCFFLQRWQLGLAWSHCWSVRDLVSQYERIGGDRHESRVP